VTRLSASMAACGQTRNSSPYQISPDALRLACFFDAESSCFAWRIRPLVSLRNRFQAEPVPDVCQCWPAITGRHCGPGTRIHEFQDPGLLVVATARRPSPLWGLVDPRVHLPPRLFEKVFWSSEGFEPSDPLGPQTRKLVERVFRKTPIKNNAIKWVWTRLPQYLQTPSHNKPPS